MKKMFQSCLLLLCCFSLVLPLAEARITKFYQLFRDVVPDLDENGLAVNVNGPHDILYKGYINTRTNNALVFARARITNLSRRFVQFKNRSVGSLLPFKTGVFSVTSDSLLISPKGRLDWILRGTFQ